jgi:hypothetical protein
MDIKVSIVPVSRANTSQDLVSRTFEGRVHSIELFADGEHTTCRPPSVMAHFPCSLAASLVLQSLHVREAFSTSCWEFLQDTTWDICNEPTMIGGHCSTIVSASVITFFTIVLPSSPV